MVLVPVHLAACLPHAKRVHLGPTAERAVQLFDPHEPRATLVLSVLAVVLLAMVSQWPSLRATRRLEVAVVVRERSI